MSRKLLIISLIVLIVVGISGDVRINRKSCGQTDRSQKFVVGGTEAQENEFPFMVSLQLKGMHFCGGSLISDRYILTAAHCIGAAIGANGKPSDLTVLIGTNNKYNVINSTLSLFNQTKTAYKVNQWIVNGCYNKRDVMSDDIALLRLSQPIDINQKSIRTICLPPPHTEPTSDRITVAGWGVWSETSSSELEGLPKSMQKADITIVSEEFCETYTYFRMFGLYGDHDLGKRLCVRQQDLSICRGDSGGPAFQIVEGRVHQFGIASFISAGLDINELIPSPIPFISNRCSKSNPGFYLKTSHYIDWINDTIHICKDQQESEITSKCFL